MVLLYNVNVVDGTLNKPYLASLLIDEPTFNNKSKNKILKIIPQSSLIDHNHKIVLEQKGIDAINFNGDYLIPLFIDAHCHSEFLYLKNKNCRLRRDDLIAVEVVGNCGISPFPVSVNNQSLNNLKSNILSILGEWPEDIYSKNPWNDYSSFKKTMATSEPTNDLYYLTGHSALRIMCMDNPNRAADKTEINKMCALLDNSLEQGSLGFSTGLYYAPCVYAENNEIIELLNVVKKHNKIFTIHRREEGDGGFDSTIEAIEFAKKTGVKLQISHLKTIGERNEKQIDRILKAIDNAKNDGVDIAFDAYPYTFGSTSLESLLPPSVLALGKAEYKKRLKDKDFRAKTSDEIMNAKGFDSIISLCGFDNISIITCENKRFIGKSISEIASEDGINPFKVFFDILTTCDKPVLMSDTTESEENLLKVLSHPLCHFATDGLYAGPLEMCHPRSREGARALIQNFAQKLGIEKVVNMASLKTANRFLLNGDWQIKQGSTVKMARVCKSLKVL